jgi:hypothetical protein
MENRLCSINKKIKEKRSIQISEPAKVNWKPRINLNLAIYLLEFLNLKDLIEFAYTNKYYLRIKDKYLQKIERFELSYHSLESENEEFLLKVLLKDSKLFTGLKFLYISNYEINKELLNFPMNNLHELTIKCCVYRSSFYFRKKIYKHIFSSKKLEKFVMRGSKKFFVNFNELFNYLENQDSLKHLIFTDSMESIFEYEIKSLNLNKLFYFKNLETLDLTGSYLYYKGKDILKNFHKLKNLKVLKLVDCMMKLEKYDIVDIIKNTSHNLELLDISENYYYRNPSNTTINFNFNNNDEHDREKFDNDWNLISDLLKERINSGSPEFKIIHNELKGI